MTQGPNWAKARAPGLDEFESLALAAYRALPDHFRRWTTGIMIRIEEFATDEVLNSLGIESEYDLMGLYQGVSLDRKSVMDTASEPDVVVLYRRPILDYWAAGDEQLGDLVTHVLVHEIGHHFGLSDDDMENIEVKAD
ncbi:MAG: metallopeptidase family protein [Hyphomicrobiaceae bacterium]